MDIMLHLLNINTNPLDQATSTLNLHHMKLQVLCEELNFRQVLKHGIALKRDVVPQALEAQGYT
jgi:hypothetical protein